MKELWTEVLTGKASQSCHMQWNRQPKHAQVIDS